MTVQLNFLPWRGLRVSRRRRFWLSLSGAGALLIFVYLYLASLLLSLTHQHTLIVGQSLAELQHHGQQHITILSQQQSDWQQTLTFFQALPGRTAACPSMVARSAISGKTVANGCLAYPAGNTCRPGECRRSGIIVTRSAGCRGAPQPMAWLLRPSARCDRA